MRILLLILFTLVLTSICPGSAEGADRPDTASLNPWGSHSVDALAAALELNVELWLEAELAGDHGQSDRLEKEILVLLNSDIFSHQERVRDMAGELTSSTKKDTPGKHAGSADSLTVQEEFQASVGLLNAKEALHRSLNKTDAFSNKYRLLGDYIDLLRRELKMPRLKLANDKLAPESDNDTQTMTGSRQDNP